MNNPIRYIKFQRALEAAVLAFLYKHPAREVDIDELRVSCPALIHDQVTQRDLEVCLSSLRWNGDIECAAAGGRYDWHSKAALDAWDYLTSEEKLARAEDWREEAERNTVLDLSTIARVSMSDKGIESCQLRTELKGDLFRFFHRMEEDAIADYFEDMLSDFEILEPIRYIDPQARLHPDKAPELREQLVTSLTELAIMIQSNNAMMANKSAEMQTAIDQLKSGTELVRSGSLTVGKLEGALWAALAYFGVKFADAPVGDAAQACWSLVKVAAQQWL